jgi:hypothetical protein
MLGASVQNLVAWNLCTPALAMDERPIVDSEESTVPFVLVKVLGSHSTSILSLPVFEPQRASQWQCVNASGSIMSLGEDFIAF